MSIVKMEDTEMCKIELGDGKERKYSQYNNLDKQIQWLRTIVLEVSSQDNTDIAKTPCRRGYRQKG
jgi:hypothetical protein